MEHSDLRSDIRSDFRSDGFVGRFGRIRLAAISARTVLVGALLLALSNFAPSAQAYGSMKPISAVLIRVDSAHDPETGYYVHVHFRIPNLKANQKYSCDIAVFSKATPRGSAKAVKTGNAGSSPTLITKWNYQSAGFPPRPAGENMSEANIRPMDVPNLGTATLKCATFAADVATR
jgi:hypothetical protein